MGENERPSGYHVGLSCRYIYIDIERERERERDPEEDKKDEDRSTERTKIPIGLRHRLSAVLDLITTLRLSLLSKDRSEAELGKRCSFKGNARQNYCSDNFTISCLMVLPIAIFISGIIAGIHRMSNEVHRLGGHIPCSYPTSVHIISLTLSYARNAFTIYICG